MAGLCSIDALMTQLKAQAPGQHVWLDPEAGLVVGAFPTMSARFDFASEQFATLEAAPAEKPRISLLGHAPRVVAIWEIETPEAIYVCGSATQALIHGLDLIETAKPGTLERLSAQKRRSKRPVARRRADLYDRPHPDSHSDCLASGYYVCLLYTSPSPRDRG